MEKTEVKGLSKQEKTKAKEQLRQQALKESGISEEDAKKITELFDLAQMPITLKDKDIKLGKGEVDFRELSDKNLKQMLFRYLTLNNLYLKDIRDSFVDVLKLLMILLGKQGVSDITKAIEELENKLREETSSKLN